MCTKPRSHLCGNRSNAIIHGASVIDPWWVEKKLEKCPGVQSAMVVPVPDNKMYQEMCMCIVPEVGCQRPTEVEIRTYCQKLVAYENHPDIPK